MANPTNNGYNGKEQRLDDQERRIQHLEEGQKEIYDLLMKVHNNIKGDSESGVRGIGNRLRDVEEKTHRQDKFIYKQKIAYWIAGGIITFGLTIFGILIRLGFI